MEEFTTGTGQIIRVHDRSKCEGQHCPIHNPSNHSMVAFKTHWRGDRLLMERICPHGIGHPDPDHIAHLKNLGINTETELVHGCDGCCKRK